MRLKDKGNVATLEEAVSSEDSYSATRLSPIVTSMSANCEATARDFGSIGEVRLVMELIERGRMSDLMRIGFALWMLLMGTVSPCRVCRGQVWLLPCHPCSFHRLQWDASGW